MKDLRNHINNKIFTVIGSAAQRLSYPTYVVGGYVRDIFLGRHNTDIDIVAVGSGISLAREVATLLGPSTHVSVFKNFGTAMLHFDGFQVEFVGARKESYSRHSRKPVVEDGTLEDDQLRRDFTINAMAISLNKGTYGALSDPFGGLKHLEEKIIQTPGDPISTFADDPLRSMRAIRFASQLHFNIEPNTWEGLVNTAHRLKIISKERISEELNKIMLSPKPSRGIHMLNNAGLLKQFLPELIRMQGVERHEKQSHKDNYKHTLEVVDNLAQMDAGLWLRWAGLLHDVGKPLTKNYSKASGYTFHGHEVTGANMVPAIFKRLKMPLNDKMRYVKKLVYLHLRPMALVEDGVTDSAIRRLLFEAGEHTDDLMKLCKADITSKNKHKVIKYRSNFEHVENKLKEVEAKDQLRNWQPPISGDLIMDTFALKPSKQVGEIKTAIREAILDGKIEGSFEKAYDYMVQIAGKMGIKPVKNNKNQ